MADPEISSLVDAVLGSEGDRVAARADLEAATDEERAAAAKLLATEEADAATADAGSTSVEEHPEIVAALRRVVGELGEVERPTGQLAVAIEQQLRFAPFTRASHKPTVDELSSALAAIGEGDAAAQSAAVSELREAARAAGVELSSESADFLRSFLRGRKYRQDEALETLKNYESMNKITNWRWLTAANPVVAAELREGLIQLLPTRCARAGESILVIDSGKMTKEKLSAGLGSTIMARHYLLESLLTDASAATGLVAIMDGRGLGLSLLPYVNREEMQLNAFMLERMMPLRLRGIFIVNAPWFFRLFWNLMANFMSKKTRERMVLVSSLDELTDIFGAANLPPQYGGTLKWDIEQELEQAVKLEEAVRSRF
jgi:hypothetical protein